MQITEQGFYNKRAFYYWSKVYSDQIENGDDFELLRKTIGINILESFRLKAMMFLTNCHTNMI